MPFQVPPGPRPVPGEPLLRVEEDPPLLVAADVHVGLGSWEPRAPRPYAATGGGLAEGLVRVARRERISRLLLLGDVKDPIGRVPWWLRDELDAFFGELTRAGLRLEVVLGNHDAGLAERLPRGIRVRGAEGLLRGGVGYFHGHAWPSDRLLRGARTLVMGHLHPGYRLALPRSPGGSGKERCWVRTLLPPYSRTDRARPRKHPWPRAREAIVLPAFNPLCANEALNRAAPVRGHRFMVRHFLLRGRSRAFLLDGTDVGEIHWGTGSPTPPGRVGD
jgi:metallophosphoesterase superfamily enzyme